MRSRLIPHSALLVLLSLLVACLPGTANAESALWSFDVKPRLWDMWTSGSATNNSVWQMIGIQVNIAYNVRATNTATGAVIACDGTGTAKVGDEIRYEFALHEYTDVSWFAKGQAYDSPYGRWIANAARPYSNMCPQYDPQDYVGKYKTTAGYGSGKFYVTLSVNPPAKSLQTGSVLECSEANESGSKTCVARSPGHADAAFTFDATYGFFYGRGTVAGVCRTANAPMQSARSTGKSWVSTGRYRLEVPPQQISCPIVFIDEQSQAPTQPSLALSGNASCVIERPLAITMTSTDPDGNAVRYAIDWNGDGSADQFVPSSGHVPSGTPQTASRTHATTGMKTVAVQAQDSTGMLSDWASISFSCAQSSGTAGLSAEAAPGTEGLSGSLPNANDLSLRVVPSLVRHGAISKVHWSSQNMTTCAVRGTNGDAWSALRSAVSGEASEPIDGRVDYTLTCTGTDGGTYIKTASVNVLPSWTEK